MRHHSIIARVGHTDTATITTARPDTHATEISFIDGNRRLSFGLGQVLDELAELGLRPSETAVDLVLLAAAVTAADTRISRTAEAQDAWTREIDIYLPVQVPALWDDLSPLIVATLNFLTGDRWRVYFRPRVAAVPELAAAPAESRASDPSVVCLFSGGLDSFIGATDLLVAGERPLLISHYWEGTNSVSQVRCATALKDHFPERTIQHIRGRVGFPSDIIGTASEDTLRARSFLFFALAVLAADAVGGNMVVHVPENGLISLNVPLDPLRLGALSTRTTHPFYMARFGDLLSRLGLAARLMNPYAFMTKGQMAKACRDTAFLKAEAKHTMSCSSPGTRRFDPDPTQRKPMHCGWCVPCLIRRAALREAFGADDTTYRIADLHARVLDTNKVEGEHVRSFQVALARLTTKPGRARFDIHRPGPLTDHPTRLRDYEAVYVAGMGEVARLLNGVQARPL